MIKFAYTARDQVQVAGKDDLELDTPVLQSYLSVRSDMR